MKANSTACCHAWRHIQQHAWNSAGIHSFNWLATKLQSHAAPSSLQQCWLLDNKPPTGQHSNGRCLFVARQCTILL